MQDSFRASFAAIVMIKFQNQLTTFYFIFRQALWKNWDGNTKGSYLSPNVVFPVINILR